MKCARENEHQLLAAALIALSLPPPMAVGCETIHERVRID